VFGCVGVYTSNATAMKWVFRSEVVTKRPRQCSRAWPHLLDGPDFVVVDQL